MKTQFWPFGLALILLLACSSSGTISQEVAPYRGRAAAYWICATATPKPTATPEPMPDWWPPVPTATPIGWATPTPTPTLWPEGTPTPTPTPEWDPPNWPPTPYPTPTPHLLVEEFYRNINVFVPVQPFLPATPVPGENSNPTLRVRVGDPIAIGASPVKDGEICYRFRVTLKNFADVPLDVDLPRSTYLKVRGDTTIYHADSEVFEALGVEYPEARLEPDEEKMVEVPLCAPAAPLEDLRLGWVSTLYESRAGMAGMGGNTGAGSDAAIYFNLADSVPGDCSYLPGEEPYPEVQAPPLLPPDLLPMTSLGGRLSGNEPVTVPPCLYITRGWGCSEYKTGVSGANRCPVEKPYWHTGIDYSCYAGTPVYNVLDGDISHWGCYRGNCNLGYGLLATVSDGTISSMYAHLQALNANPACTGMHNACAQGAAVGEVGTTGFSTGNHLHWEVRVNGVPVNPAYYFGGGQSGHPRSALTKLLPPAQISTTLQSAPLQIRLRDPEGNALSGPTIEVYANDNLIEMCVFIQGECVFDLRPGVYSLRLGGAVDGGYPIHEYGLANEQAMTSELTEYHHGPLAVWHDAPGTIAGLVLITKDGVGQPYLDASPEGTPVAMNPLEGLEIPPVAEPTAPNALLVSESLEDRDQTSLPSALLATLFFLFLALLVGGLYYLWRYVLRGPRQ